MPLQSCNEKAFYNITTGLPEAEINRHATKGVRCNVLLLYSQKKKVRSFNFNHRTIKAVTLRMSASKPPINILLADDDEDDCLFFQDALKELPVSTLLQTVSNGDQLMERLHDKQQFLPDLLFLDLNMPRKNGLDCLEEIKQHTDLNRLFIAIYSTSLQQHIVDKVHEIGAQYYICKPTSFSKLKNLIFQTIAFKETDSNLQPSRGKFVLSQEIFTNEKK